MLLPDKGIILLEESLLLIYFISPFIFPAIGKNILNQKGVLFLV